MANLTITDIDNGDLQLGGSVFNDEVVTFGAAGTVLKGTILARNSSTLKLIPYVKGGSSNGNGIPKAVAPHDIVATAVSDVPVRALIAGRVNQRRLVIHADGTAANIDGAVRDQLRAQAIIPVDVTQLGREDNPQSSEGDS